MLSKSFKAGKCKTSLKMASARIKLLRNKRDVQLKSMRKELAQLLESGQEQTARIRVEHVIREEKTISAYDLIELFCELIATRLPIIESQKSCPVDLKEAISSVIFASPRCADIPELMDIRKHFVAKYGKEFTNSALEVRPDCGVSRLVVEKLSARAPDVETKIKVLSSIAEEHNVKWDAKALEEQLKKPKDDLLNGPSIFSSSNNMAKESSSVNYTPTTNRTKESSFSQNAVSKPTSVDTISYTDSRASSISEPLRSQPKPRASESSTVTGVESSNPREENASSNRPAWNMEFKDATSAAQAAAESAERASIAARAAAELASRESFSRQNSSGSNASPTYRVKTEKPNTSRSSKLKGEDFVAHAETGEPQEMQSEKQYLQSEVTQEVFRGEAGETNDGYPSVQEAARRSSHSSQTNVNDDFLNGFNVTSYDHDPQISSASEAVGHNSKNVKQDNVEYARECVVNYSESDSFQAGTFDAESIRYPDYGNNVVFDDYGSVADDDHDVDLVFGSSKEESLFSHQGEGSSVPHSSIDLASPTQYTSGSLSRNDSSRLHLFTEHEKFPEKPTQVFFPPQFDEDIHAAFDDIGGLSSESEDEKDSCSHNKAMRPSNRLHNGRGFEWNFEESCHGLDETSFDERQEVADNVIRSESPRLSGGNKNEHETRSYLADTISKETGSSSSLENRSSSRIDKAASNSYDLRRGLDDNSSDEEVQPLRSLNVQSTKKSEANEQSQLPSLPLHISDPLIPSSLTEESGPSLNYGRLTGGFKHRGFPRPPYVKNSMTDDSLSLSEQASSGTYSISEKPTTSDVGKISTSIDFLNQELLNQELQPKGKVPISRTSGSSIDSYSMLHDEKLGTKAQKKSNSRRPVTSPDLDDDRGNLDSDSTSENKASVEVKLSRRTRVVPSDGKSSVLKFTGRSGMESRSSRTSSVASEAHVNASHDPVNIHKKDDSKPLERNLLQPTEAPRQIFSAHEGSPKVSQLSSREKIVPVDNVNKSPQSSDGSASRENTFKKAPHTHPKLPENASHDPVNIHKKDDSKPLERNLLQPTEAPRQIFSAHEGSPKVSQLSSREKIVPADNVNKSPQSSDGSASRENTFKKAPHTHPKLPDYDSIAARFKLLRSNRE